MKSNYEKAYFPEAEPARKDKGIFSKFVVITLLLTIIAYVTTVFYFVWHGIYPPDSLTYTFLPAVIAELGVLGVIERKNKDVEIAKIHAQQGQYNKGEHNKGGIL